MTKSTQRSQGLVVSSKQKKCDARLAQGLIFKQMGAKFLNAEFL